MGRTRGLVALASLAGILAGASRSLPLGDAQRGRELFQARKCIQCHAVAGKGGKTAPDLAMSVVRGFSPYQLAAALWNHLPQMSVAWRQQGLAWTELSEQDAADLFLYLYASRYFEAPGDAGRGRSVFRSKRCAGCHGLSTPVRAGIPPVSAWGSLENAVTLAQGMMNHSSGMLRELERTGTVFPRLSPVELTDLLAYLRGQVRKSELPGEFSPGSAERGKAVFASKGCLACHRGTHSFEARPTRHTLTDFVSALWNHPIRVQKEPITLSYSEMRDLMGYLLATQFSEERGDPTQGRRVYERKRCGSCHDDPASGAPPRAGMAGRMTSFGMAAALWRHGPGMLGRMQERKVGWPSINSLEMVDLIAYLHGAQLKRRP